MRGYEEKIIALKRKISSKLEVYKAICRKHLIESDFAEEEYIVEYHYLILLDNYIKRKDAFNEYVCGNRRQLNNEVLNKMLGNKYDVVWNYLQTLDFRYKHVDIITLFNNEMTTMKDFSREQKEHL